MDESQDKPGFRVTDRRRFDDAGESRTTGDAEAGDAAQVGTTAPRSEARATDDRRTSATDDQRAAAPEPMTFSTFVLGLSTQALLHLGEIESPLSGKVEQDLGAAKQMIDILGILHDKTRNNLEQAEAHLLDSILYDLRMRYVDIVRAPKKEGE